MRRKGFDLASPSIDVRIARVGQSFGTPPTYTAEALGFRQTDTRRFHDSREAIGGPPAPRKRPARPPRQPGLNGIHLVDADTLPFAHGRDLYTLRTKSHLYDERHVEQTVEQWHTIAKRDGLLIADCHACRVSVPVAPDAERCGYCGTGF